MWLIPFSEQNLNYKRTENNYSAFGLKIYDINVLKKLIGGGLAVNGSEYAQQIADIQHKQKAKRHASLSSENFSSSR
jgi:hypothetical protein